VGLGLIYGAQRGLPPWLRHADPVAGLLVAGISLYVGLRLGHETVGALLDAAPEGVPETIAAAIAGIPGVRGHERIRVRQSGNKLFVDLRLVLDSNIALERAAAVTEAVERRVREIYPTADVVVDASPRHPASGEVLEQIRSVANRENFQIHDVSALRVGPRVNVDLDLEVDSTLSLAEAHEEATRLEELLRRDVPAVGEVNVHLEPRQQQVSRARKARRAQADLERKLVEIVRSTPGVLDCHALDVLEADHEVLATVHCTVGAGLGVTEVHAITEALEQRLREAFPRLTRANIHAEPQAARG
jgi:divalent metal cation (Fe/Co/Zn/Cd) transporter